MVNGIVTPVEDHTLVKLVDRDEDELSVVGYSQEALTLSDVNTLSIASGVIPLSDGNNKVLPVETQKQIAPGGVNPSLQSILGTLEGLRLAPLAPADVPVLSTSVLQAGVATILANPGDVGVSAGTFLYEGMTYEVSGQTVTIPLDSVRWIFFDAAAPNDGYLTVDTTYTPEDPTRAFIAKATNVGGIITELIDIRQNTARIDDNGPITVGNWVGSYPNSRAHFPTLGKALAAIKVWSEAAVNARAYNIELLSNVTEVEDSNLGLTFPMVIPTNGMTIDGNGHTISWAGVTPVQQILFDINGKRDLTFKDISVEFTGATPFYDPPVNLNDTWTGLNGASTVTADTASGNADTLLEPGAEVIFSGNPDTYTVALGGLTPDTFGVIPNLTAAVTGKICTRTDAHGPPVTGVFTSSSGGVGSCKNILIENCRSSLSNIGFFFGIFDSAVELDNLVIRGCRAESLANTAVTIVGNQGRVSITDCYFGADDNVGAYDHSNYRWAIQLGSLAGASSLGPSGRVLIKNNEINGKGALVNYDFEGGIYVNPKEMGICSIEDNRLSYIKQVDGVGVGLWGNAAIRVGSDGGAVVKNNYLTLINSEIGVHTLGPQCVIEGNNLNAAGSAKAVLAEGDNTHISNNILTNGDLLVRKDFAVMTGVRVENNSVVGHAILIDTGAVVSTQFVVTGNHCENIDADDNGGALVDSIISNNILTGSKGVTLGATQVTGNIVEHNHFLGGGALETGDLSAITGNIGLTSILVGDGLTTGDCVIRGNAGPAAGLSISARGRAIVTANRNLYQVTVGGLGKAPTVTDNQFSAAGGAAPWIYIQQDSGSSTVSGNAQDPAGGPLLITVAGFCPGTRISNNYTNGGDIITLSARTIINNNILSTGVVDGVTGFYITGDIELNYDTALPTDHPSMCIVTGNTVHGGDIIAQRGNNVITGNILISKEDALTIDSAIDPLRGHIKIAQGGTAQWNQNCNSVIGNIYRSDSAGTTGPVGHVDGHGDIMTNEDLCTVLDDPGVPAPVFRRLNVEE